MIGAGIALLLADRLSAEQRKAVGATLATVGLVTTISCRLGDIRQVRVEPAGVSNAISAEQSPCQTFPYPELWRHHLSEF